MDTVWRIPRSVGAIVLLAVALSGCPSDSGGSSAITFLVSGRFPGQATEVGAVPDECRVERSHPPIEVGGRSSSIVGCEGGGAFLLMEGEESPDCVVVTAANADARVFPRAGCAGAPEAVMAPGGACAAGEAPLTLAFLGTLDLSGGVDLDALDGEGGTGGTIEVPEFDDRHRENLSPLRLSDRSTLDCTGGRSADAEPAARGTLECDPRSAFGPTPIGATDVSATLVDCGGGASVMIFTGPEIGPDCYELQQLPVGEVDPLAQHVVIIGDPECAGDFEPEEVVVEGHLCVAGDGEALAFGVEDLDFDVASVFYPATYREGYQFAEFSGSPVDAAGGDLFGEFLDGFECGGTEAFATIP